MMYRYPPTRSQFRDLFNKQNGKCYLCGTALIERHTHVDHNHKTGFVRSILCAKCNTTIGCYEAALDKSNSESNIIGVVRYKLCQTGYIDLYELYDNYIKEFSK